MLQGTKVRGSDNTPNFVIINSIFHKVTPELVSYEMELSNGTLNIYCMGYSKPFKRLFIQFVNGDRYIYTCIKKDLWQKRHEYQDLAAYYHNEIVTLPRDATDEQVQSITNEYVLDAYLKLEYFHTITSGMWATDQPGKLIDPDNLLFEITPVEF